MARVDRTIRRIQEKKTMKNRIKNLRMAARVAFKAGKESVLLAAHGLSYGEGYEVTQQNVSDSGTGNTDGVGSGILDSAPTLDMDKPSVPFIVPA
jgi:hypothetical protein